MLCAGNAVSHETALAAGIESSTDANQLRRTIEAFIKLSPNTAQ